MVKEWNLTRFFITAIRCLDYWEITNQSDQESFSTPQMEWKDKHNAKRKERGMKCNKQRVIAQERNTFQESGSYGVWIWTREWYKSFGFAAKKELVHIYKLKILVHKGMSKLYRCKRRVSISQIPIPATTFSVSSAFMEGLPGNCACGLWQVAHWINQ